MKRMLAFFMAFFMLLMSVSCGTNKETRWSSVVVQICPKRLCIYGFVNKF